MPETNHSDVVVVGALAYDQLAASRDPVADDGQPRLNFKLQSVTETFGGCGANIAYNLAQLDVGHRLLTCTGALDDSRYLEHCRQHGMPTDGFLTMPEQSCSRALIITDPQGHQITGFYPGPELSGTAWRMHLEAISPSCRIWVQAPYPAALMQTSLEFASSLSATPLRIWNPGQYAEILCAAEIQSILARTDWLIVNRHEFNAVAPYLSDQLVIRTNGAGAVNINYPDGRKDTVDVPLVDNAIDPTGCGDAFTSGILHHLTRSAGSFTECLADAVAAGITCARACLRCTGAQRHRLSTP